MCLYEKRVRVEDFFSRMLDMGGSDTCSWKSDICPHRVYNFTTTTEKSKVEGRQSRFLGLILGMDPLSALRASGQIAKPFRNGPHYDQINTGAVRER